MLRRGSEPGERPVAKGEPRDRRGRRLRRPSAEWKLGGDLGRRYAAVSGDRNPIHMHALTAKPLGFPAAIAHGMWTKARCLAALEPRLPDSFTAEVAFRRPILLPGRVEFSSRPAGERNRVRRARRQEAHPPPEREHQMTHRRPTRRSPTAAWASG